jgi:hypothetical protein
VFAGELGEHVPGDDFAARRVFRRRQHAAVDPAAHGVVTDPEQFGRLADPDVWHRDSVSAGYLTNNRKYAEIAGFEP